MKLTTNIILEGNTGPTSSYMFQLLRNTKQMSTYIFTRQDDESWPGEHAAIFKFGENKYWTRKGNEWYQEYIHGSRHDIQTSVIRMFFPQYSVDTYNVGCTYALTLSTYIHGVEIELGSYIFKRNEALACTPTRFDGMDEYFEYIDFQIADPFSILYDDIIRGIKRSLGDPDHLNDNGSILSISLNIVEEGEGCYILKNGWTGGQNEILISDPTDMSLNIGYDVDDRSISLKLSFNKEFRNDLLRYIKETYNCEESNIKWEYVLMDNDNIYYQENIEEFNDRVNLSIQHVDVFSSWENWKEGLYLQAVATFFNESEITDDSMPFMEVFSNKLPVSQDLFALMIQDENYIDFPTTIDLNSLNMNDINLTAINKIVQDITVVTPTDTAKNHMIQPVFYQTREIGKVNIHPQVTENISINLDAYKSRVKTFMIQVEGVSFPEVGRTNKGVVFKISGNMLPKSINEGTLYLLDQDGVLVTTGKYIYVY